MTTWFGTGLVPSVLEQLVDKALARSFKRVQRRIAVAAALLLLLNAVGGLHWIAPFRSEAAPWEVATGAGWVVMAGWPRPERATVGVVALACGLVLSFAVREVLFLSGLGVGLCEGLVLVGSWWVRRLGRVAEASRRLSHGEAPRH